MRLSDHCPANDHRNDVKRDGHVKDVLVAHRVHLDGAAVGQNLFGKLACVADDPTGHLVSGQAGDGPSAKAHSVDGRNALHSKVVAEQSGNV